MGAAVARLLSHHDVSVVLIDKSTDVGTGTSKANTAILHTGFDAIAGSLESGLVRRGYGMLLDYAAATGIAVERTGALLVAWDREQHEALKPVQHKAMRNKYFQSREIDAAELYRLEPHLGPGALGALELPGESLIDPWSVPIAYATEAVTNGAELILGSSVERIDAHNNAVILHTDRGIVRCDWVINAAGLYADELNRQLGYDTFTVKPRRGQLIVFDKLSRPLVNHILLAVPTARSKGVLVSPTVFGNIMVGPTAEDVGSKTDLESTPEGIATLLATAGVVVPELLDEEVTAVYAGIRAATQHSDYSIEVHREHRTITVGGIRSTGLSASMAIAEYTLELLREEGVSLDPKRDPTPIAMPNLGDAFPRAWHNGGRIVCHCERVTQDEIEAATYSLIPARDIDGLRRRTRALSGRCQGFFCRSELQMFLPSLAS